VAACLEEVLDATEQGRQEMVIVTPLEEVVDGHFRSELFRGDQPQGQLQPARVYPFLCAVAFLHL
jgi:hypothetical protein